MLLHKNIKPYRCHICHKAFTEKGTLLSHQVTHTNDKPYQCQFCLYRSKTVPQLKNHLKKEHGEEYFYYCDKCKAKFTKKSELKHHILQHAMDKLGNEICGESVQSPNIFKIPEDSSLSTMSLIKNEKANNDLFEVREVSYSVYMYELNENN